MVDSEIRLPLRRLRPSSGNQDNSDMLANIARLGMGFANVFSTPLMFSGLRHWADQQGPFRLSGRDFWPDGR